MLRDRGRNAGDEAEYIVARIVQRWSENPETKDKPLSYFFDCMHLGIPDNSIMHRVRLADIQTCGTPSELGLVSPVEQVRLQKTRYVLMFIHIIHTAMNQISVK